MLNLTSEQREIIATAAQQELARRSLESFLLYDGRGMWKTAKHLKMLISELEKVERNVKEKFKNCKNFTLLAKKPENG